MNTRDEYDAWLSAQYLLDLLHKLDLVKIRTIADYLPMLYVIRNKPEAIAKRKARALNRS